MLPKQPILRAAAGPPPCIPKWPPLTCQVSGTVCVSLPVRVTLLDGGGPVAQGGGEDGSAMLHQNRADGSVIAGCSTVQRGPGVGRCQESQGVGFPNPHIPPASGYASLTSRDCRGN